MKVIGILLAAGSSKRFEADKLFIEYEDKELIRFPIETFLKNKNISLLVIVCNKENIKRINANGMRVTGRCTIRGCKVVKRQKCGSV